LVRAMDAGGLISVYREDEAAALEEQAAPRAQAQSDAGAQAAGAGGLSGQEFDWQGLLRTSADLIAAIERAARSAGANFEAIFHTARLELADDYEFLDPGSGGFQYANNEIELLSSPSPRAFVSGICEALRRVVERLVAGGRSASMRERVALELAVLARRRARQLEYFGLMPQLDRIAGTRVI
ncbi:MAG TPA: hypothetical protein VEQ40_01405, partial [Pyrinomonadaceae bacterium]|nr:hypothetical protein [Pyrinomonadaceae bacterium]